MWAVERPAHWAVIPGARKSERNIGATHASSQEHSRPAPARRTRVPPRGGRSVRRKRRPPAAVDNPAPCHANILEQPEGSPVSALGRSGALIPQRVARRVV